MEQNRITQDMLLSRMGVLYASDTLDYENLDIESLSEKYDAIARQITTVLGVEERREWNSYGCGIATFLESWFYREEKLHEVSYPGMVGRGYRGVSVVFCLLEPMFAIGESTQFWDKSGDSAGSILPSLEMIDAFETSEIRTLGDQIRRVIWDMGIEQVSRRTLDVPISKGIRIESNLAHGELKLFDAFYHWID